MGSFSKRDREAMRRAQFGRCAFCGRELDEFEAHAILPDVHTNPHVGLALCHECHEKTLTYGKGWKGLTDFYGHLDLEE